MQETHQIAPYPEALFRLVEDLRYKDGWAFTLEDLDRGQGSRGLTLVVHLTTVDSYHPGQPFAVVHYMIVPAAPYDERSWRRWLFEQILLVERHEASEFFLIGEDRPYAPSHGPGNDPYITKEIGTVEDQRTTFRGERF